MEPVQQGLLVAALSGATALVKMVFPEKVSGYVTIGVVVVLGLLAGLSGLEGLNPVSGVLTALATVGVVNFADRMGRGNQ